MKRIITLLLLGLLLVFPFGVRTVLGEAGQVVLEPTDNVTAAAANPSRNLGGMVFLTVQNGTVGSPPNEYSLESLAWLKFSLTTVPNGAAIDAAVLQLFSTFPYGTNDVSVYSCRDTSWAESTVTYSNMPAYNNTPMDHMPIKNVNQWYSWNVVNAVTNAINVKPQAVTIVLGEPIFNNTVSRDTFCSKEYSQDLGDFSPKLVVQWSKIVPEFPTYNVLGLLMIGVSIGITLCKKKTSN